MKPEQAVNVFDLARRSGGIPEKMEELVPLAFIGTAAVSFYRAKVKALGQLEAAQAQREATLRDGQAAGEMLLDIEAKIGQIAKAIPQEQRKPEPLHSKGGPVSKHDKVGLTRKQMDVAETIAAHPEAVAAVKREAREAGEIPTKTAVLGRVQADRREAERARIMKLDIQLAPDEPRPSDLKVRALEEEAERVEWAKIRLAVHDRRKIVGMAAKVRNDIARLIEQIREELDAKSWEVEDEKAQVSGSRRAIDFAE